MAWHFSSIVPSLQDAVRTLGRLPRRAARGRFLQQSSIGWFFGVALIVAVVLTPIVTLILLALSPGENVWPHLLEHVLPASLADTFVLLVGAGLSALAVGTLTAWLVTMYRFPGRSIVDLLLVIPLAMPTYIVAYCYVEFLDFTGPVQTALRALLNVTSARDYWFFEIRSVGGAIVVMSAVLYPYVYLAARASFIQQSVCVLEVARTLGRTPLGVFWEVALPLSRPALAAGLALVLMECLNDIGAVKYLGVQTLTRSVYDRLTYGIAGEQGGVGEAAQIAVVLLGFVFCLLLAERLARGQRQSHHTTGRYRSIPFEELKGWKAVAVLIVCTLPFVIGFAVPMLVLLGHAFQNIDQALENKFHAAVFNSLTLSALAAAIAVGLALVLSYARRITADKFARSAVRLASLGYAIPGTILALGLLYPIANLDTLLNGLRTYVFGGTGGALLSGSIFALVIAYCIRFLAVSLSTTEAGLEKISPNLDAAARALGENTLTTLTRVHLPMLAPALGAALLLVFVDSMKELPATLLLRPFNFDTLATHVYGYAQLEQFEMAALGALAIVLVGLLPVLLLHKAVTRGRPGTT